MYMHIEYKMTTFTFIFYCCPQDETMGHFEGPNNQQPGGVAKCDDIEMKGLTELLTEA